MNKSQILLMAAVLIWFACGVYVYGVAYKVFNSRAVALIHIPLGPLGLIAALEFRHYGWQWRRGVDE